MANRLQIVADCSIELLMNTATKLGRAWPAAAARLKLSCPGAPRVCIEDPASELRVLSQGSY